MKTMAVHCGWILSCAFILIHASVIPAERGHDPDPMMDKDHVKGDEHDAKYDHEQFLGKEEAEKYEDLTPEQSKERLSKLVPIIDKDGDGMVTEEELKDHIAYMQKRYVTNDVDRTWDSYEEDKKEGGLLRWKDYQSLVYGVEEGEELTERTKEYENMLVRDRRRWKASDTSGDDNLDKTEYACFMHPEDCNHMQDIVVMETLEDIDKDKDGVISMEEYIGDMYRADDYPELQGKEPEWVDSERDMFRDHRDINKDGVLDKEEMKTWIMPAGFDHAEAEARHLVHMADDNKDGTLDPEEILAHYDVFVGSQATDYGEQLQRHDPSEL